MGRGALTMSGLSFQTVPPRGEPARFSDVRHFAEVDSTNRLALELARAGAAEGAVVVADHQTAGRGRRGRTWTAPPRSALLASVLLRPPVAPGTAPVVAMAVALAASDACAEVAGVRPALKWPNDLMGPGGAGKLAGVLGEALVEGGRLEALVVGMGLNVSPAAATLAGSVSLEALAGAPVGRGDVLAAWLDHLEGWYPMAVGGGPEVLDAYRRRCVTLGQAVRVELADGSLVGTAAAVTDLGHLVVDTAAGPRPVSAADVVHLRPAH